MQQDHIEKLIKESGLYGPAMEMLSRVPCRIAQVINPDTNKYFAASNINWFEITRETVVTWTENPEDALLILEAKQAYVILLFLKDVGQLPEKTGIELAFSKMRSIIVPTGITYKT